MFLPHNFIEHATYSMRLWFYSPSKDKKECFHVMVTLEFHSITYTYDNLMDIWYFIREMENIGEKN